MRVYSEDSIQYWLNYLVEEIKNDVESKNGKCKLQLSFTGNLIFLRGYTNLIGYQPSNLINNLVEQHPKTLDIFGNGVRNSLIYLSEIKNNQTDLCFTYYYNEYGRPILNPIHSEPRIIYTSEIPFGYSLDFKVPFYYGEFISKDLLKFTRAQQVHIDYKGEENLDIVVKSIYSKKDIESCVLDIYDFNFESFKEKLTGYNFIKEITEPYTNKPWLSESLLKEYIIF